MFGIVCSNLRGIFLFENTSMGTILTLLVNIKFELLGVPRSNFRFLEIPHASASSLILTIKRSTNNSPGKRTTIVWKRQTVNANWTLAASVFSIFSCQKRSDSLHHTNHSGVDFYNNRFSRYFSSTTTTTTTSWSPRIIIIIIILSPTLWNLTLFQRVKPQYNLYPIYISTL